jgi:hypothetical protein
MSAPKRCFVISPIGQRGSEVREHADDVFEYIIKPAMDEVGIAFYRADHDTQSGRITDQMFESILKDDLCIAVLSFQNPNVFYELAVAQSAARPVIILNFRGHPLPFDIKDMRVIEYDFRPKAIIERTYVKQIVDMVRNLESRNWSVSVPFGIGLSPLGRDRGQVRVYDRFEDFGRTEAWLEILSAADGPIELSGITLRNWTRIPRFRDLLKGRAVAGCPVRVLCLHPENQALPYYLNPRIHKKVESESGAAAQSRAYFSELAGEQPGVQVRMMNLGCHHQQMFRVGGRMFCSLVLFSEGTHRSPMIECRAGCELFEILGSEFQALWDANAPL